MLSARCLSRVPSRLLPTKRSYQASSLVRTQTSHPFITMVQPLTNLTLTENDSWACKSSLDPRVDLFYGVLPGYLPEYLQQKLDASWQVSPLDTLKIIFNFGAVRFGKADTGNFVHGLAWLYEHHPLTTIANVKVVPETGYWKHLLLLLEHLHYERQVPKLRRLTSFQAKRERKAAKREERLKRTPEEKLRLRQEAIEASLQLGQSQKLAAKERKTALQARRAQTLQELQSNENYRKLRAEIVNLYVTALKKDLEKMRNNKRIGLVGKWTPTSGLSADTKTGITDSIIEAFYGCTIDDQNKLSLRMQFQKEVLAPLRRYAKVPEVCMSANQWDSVVYSRVPSVCMSRNAKLFENHDPVRYMQFLRDVRVGTKRVASGALLPHRLVKRVLYADQDDELAELQWKSMVSNLKKEGTLEQSFAVCDVSGSMNGTPMEVAIALSILLTEVSEDPWNIICTFSESPQFFEIPRNRSLQQKANFTVQMQWDMNTNFQLVFDRLLERAKETKLAREDMVKHIFVFSDMQFDEAAVSPTSYATDYEILKSKFADAGYDLPVLIFWNLRNTFTVPTTHDTPGVALVSGFSPNMLKLFLGGKVGDLLRMTPADILKATLDQMPIASKLTVVD